MSELFYQRRTPNGWAFISADDVAFWQERGQDIRILGVLPKQPQGINPSWQHQFRKENGEWSDWIDGRAPEILRHEKIEIQEKALYSTVVEPLTYNELRRAAAEAIDALGSFIIEGNDGSPWDIFMLMKIIQSMVALEELPSDPG